MSGLRYFTFVILFLIVTRLVFGIAAAQETADPTTSAVTSSDWTHEDFWERIAKNTSADSWEFVNGEIRLVRPQGGKGNLISGPLPSNFELSFEWKIESRTNTGLKYRVRKYGSQYYGVEYQIIDDKPTDSSNGSTASIYDLIEPSSSKNLNPAGQWNSAKIIANGTSLQHFLNGDLVASTATVGPAWDASFAVSKFWDWKVSDNLAQVIESC